jgi:alkylhydroperoxidase/carboxymuconolactone decarboxylase family protein YurZ
MLGVAGVEVRFHALMGADVCCRRDPLNPFYRREPDKATPQGPLALGGKSHCRFRASCVGLDLAPLFLAPSRTQVRQICPINGRSRRRNHVGRSLRPRPCSQAGHVQYRGAEKQIDAATDYTQPMRGLIKRDCFGEVWNRPRPDRCTQSRLTNRVLVTISKPHEVRAYVRGAIANGASKETPELHHKPSNQVAAADASLHVGFRPRAPHERREGRSQSYRHRLIGQPARRGRSEMGLLA